MANKIIDFDDNSVFGKVYKILDSDSKNYFDYYDVKHYDPEDESQRAPASRAFMYWFLENNKDYKLYEKTNIKEQIVDLTNDQGIDASMIVIDDDDKLTIWFYQAKFWQENIDEDVVRKMRNLWTAVKRGRDGFNGEIKDKLENLHIFECLDESDVDVNFVLLTTSELESSSFDGDKSALDMWNDLAKEMSNDKTRKFSLIKYDKTYLNDNFNLGAEV